MTEYVIVIVFDDKDKSKTYQVPKRYLSKKIEQHILGNETHTKEMDKTLKKWSEKGYEIHITANGKNLVSENDINKYLCSSENVFDDVFMYHPKIQVQRQTKTEFLMDLMKR
jgi:hypothetical protein